MLLLVPSGKTNKEVARELFEKTVDRFRRHHENRRNARPVPGERILTGPHVRACFSTDGTLPTFAYLLAFLRSIGGRSGASRARKAPSGS